MRLFLAVSLSVALCYSSWAGAVPEKDWTRLESIFQQLKTDNESLSALLLESEMNFTESRNRLTEAKQQLTLAQQELIEQQRALTSAQEELTTLRQSLSETQNSLQKLTTSLDAIKNDRLLWAVGAGLLGVVLGFLAPGMPWR